MKLVKEIEARNAGAKLNTQDGIRIDWKDAWLHVRPSGTEPAVRIIGEAPSAERIDGLIAQYTELAKQMLAADEAKEVEKVDAQDSLLRFRRTITEHDTLDAVQDVYGPKDWREQYAKMRREGASSREVTRRVLETCSASPEEVERLIAGIGIRAGFEEFVEYVRGHGYEFTITSEGIDLSIKAILHARGLDDIPYFTNRFVINKQGRPSTTHQHSHPDCRCAGTARRGTSSRRANKARQSYISGTRGRTGARRCWRT